MIKFILLLILFSGFLGVVYQLWKFRSLLSTDRRCANCKSPTITRSPRSNFDRQISQYVDCRKFRCMSCGWAGLIRVNPNQEAEKDSKQPDPVSSSGMDIAIPPILGNSTTE